MADNTVVHQVLLNLGTNAAHAMNGAGVIEILLAPFYARDSVTRLHPELREGPYAKLAVKDTGSGMTPEVVARVFEPFYSTKNMGEGTGLGLPMVRSLMRDHGGTVIIDSEPGQGTTVTCYFPASEIETRSLPELVVTGAIPRGHGERILLVDDQPAMADVGARRLRSLGYVVTACTDAAEALAALEADPASWDVLVTDYSMPAMSGLELAWTVTRRRPDLPVLMLTGWAEDLPSDRVHAAGVRALLVKPATLEELAVAVQRHPDAGQQLSPCVLLRCRPDPLCDNIHSPRTTHRLAVATGPDLGHGASAGTSCAGAIPILRYLAPPSFPENVPAPERQGGDTIETAVSIPSLPFADTGTTTRYNDDNDEVCPMGSIALGVGACYVVVNGYGGEPDGDLRHRGRTDQDD